jgi:hypothetical protein
VPYGSLRQNAMLCETVELDGYGTNASPRILRDSAGATEPVQAVMSDDAAHHSPKR